MLDISLFNNFLKIIYYSLFYNYIRMAIYIYTIRILFYEFSLNVSKKEFGFIGIYLDILSIQSYTFIYKPQISASCSLVCYLGI